MIIYSQLLFGVQKGSLAQVIKILGIQAGKVIDDQLA